MDMPDGALFSRVSSSLDLLSSASISPQTRSGSYRGKKQNLIEANTGKSQHLPHRTKEYQEAAPITRESAHVLREQLRKTESTGELNIRTKRGNVKSETDFTVSAGDKAPACTLRSERVHSLNILANIRHSHTGVVSAGNRSDAKSLSTRNSNTCSCGSEPCLETNLPNEDISQKRGTPCQSTADGAVSSGSNINERKSMTDDEAAYEFFQRRPHIPSVTESGRSNSFILLPSTNTPDEISKANTIPDISVSNYEDNIPLQRMKAGNDSTLSDKHKDTASNRSSVFYVGDNDETADIEKQTETTFESSPRLYPKLSTTDSGKHEENGLDHTDAGTKRGDVANDGKKDDKCYHQLPTKTDVQPFMLEEQGEFRPNILRIVTRLLLPILSLGIYIWDLGSDIRLAITYKENGEVNLFWVTLACIVIPLVLMSIVDVSWVWLDSASCSTSYVARYILGALSLGRIVRAFLYMFHIVKSETLPSMKERAWHQKRATEEKRDCLMLDFINAFAESAPQLFVQMYLLYAFNLELSVVRVLNLLSSWISIAWTYAAYYRCNREALAGRQDVNVIGFVTFFLSVLAALAARVMCVVLFLVYFRPWIGAVLLSVHFTLMLLWIRLREKPTFEGTTSSSGGRFLYCVFFSYVSLLCFVNLQPTQARYRMILFYLIVYIENFIIAGFTLHTLINLETESNIAFNLLALPLGLVCHVVLLVLYYLTLHPKTGRCFKQNLTNMNQDSVDM